MENEDSECKMGDYEVRLSPDRPKRGLVIVAALALAIAVWGVHNHIYKIPEGERPDFASPGMTVVEQYNYDGGRLESKSYREVSTSLLESYFRTDDLPQGFRQVKEFIEVRYGVESIVSEFDKDGRAYFFSVQESSKGYRNNIRIGYDIASSEHGDSVLLLRSKDGGETSFLWTHEDKILRLYSKEDTIDLVVLKEHMVEEHQPTESTSI
ncbi:MAG: hypothetical protein GF416_03850 [Candidatus Altiarchaeales archaeon]|nr:hypothetical protein [Candidatus Altiarchaeales archaeon]MBD3416253.1 hypothetical protein [Candidatus Altiarchaeales archaeon]